MGVKQRNSNIELLRIIAMLMIVTVHYLSGGNSGALSGITEPSQRNYFIVRIAETANIIGPNIFVAISALFMVDKNEIRFRKIIDLYVLTVFWNIVLFGVSCVAGATEFTVKTLLQVCLPFLAGRWWFVETYILLMIVAPFLNKLFRSINKKSMTMLIVFELLVYSVWPSLLTSSPTTDKGYGLVNFITIYTLIAFVRMHIERETLKKHRYKLLAGYFACLAGNIALNLSCAIIPSGSGFVYKLANMISGRTWNYDFILNIPEAVFITLFFYTADMKPNRMINAISKTTFGVYLLHCNQFMNGIVFDKILRCGSYFASPYFIVHMIGSVLLLFAASSTIEYARKMICGKTVSKWCDKMKSINKVLYIE